MLKPKQWRSISFLPNIVSLNNIHVSLSTSPIIGFMLLSIFMVKWTKMTHKKLLIVCYGMYFDSARNVTLLDAHV
jgi:hypothetical protein